MFETRFKYRKYIETGRVFIGVESFVLVRVIAASFKKRFDFRFASTAGKSSCLAATVFLRSSIILVELRPSIQPPLFLRLTGYELAGWFYRRADNFSGLSRMGNAASLPPTFLLLFSLRRNVSI